MPELAVCALIGKYSCHGEDIGNLDCRVLQTHDLCAADGSLGRWKRDARMASPIRQAPVQAMPCQFHRSDADSRTKATNMRNGPPVPRIKIIKIAMKTKSKI